MAVPLPDKDIQPSSRARILASASALFTAHGYADVSMQQIADAVGINKATLYHHFRDKDALFLTVVRDFHDGIRLRCIEALGAGGSLRDQFCRVGSVVFASSRSDYARLFGDVRRYLSPECQLSLMQASPPVWHVLAEALTQAVESGEIRPIDPRLTAEIVWGTLIGQIGMSRLPSASRPLDDELAAAIADLLLDGLRPADGASVT